jgi:hypothetical protein
MAVETFGGRDRVFRLGEIIEASVPMTPDTTDVADKRGIK